MFALSTSLHSSSLAKGPGLPLVGLVLLATQSSIETLNQRYLARKRSQINALGRFLSGKKTRDFLASLRLSGTQNRLKPFTPSFPNSPHNPLPHGLIGPHQKRPVKRFPSPGRHPERKRGFSAVQKGINVKYHEAENRLPNSLHIVSRSNRFQFSDKKKRSLVEQF